MIHIDYATMRRLVSAEVEKEGADFVYEKRDPKGANFPLCLYVHEGKPDCLIGRALHAAGVSLDDLESGEGSTARQMLEWLEGRGVVTYTAEARNFATVVQNLQDEGFPWGEALRNGVGYVRNSKEN